MGITNRYAAVCLARDREWIEDRWIEAMRGQSVPPAHIVRSVFPFHDYQYDDPFGIEYVSLYHEHKQELAWKRGETPALASSERMANLRNDLVDTVFSRHPEIDSVLSCDSDIILAPDGAEKLLSVDADLVCAPVLNGPDVNDVFLYRDKDGKHYGRLPKEMLNDDERVARVASGGACVLIHRKAWEAGLRYEPHPQCENVGLGEVAHGLKLKYRCHCGVRTVHWMTQERGWDSHEY